MIDPKQCCRNWVVIDEDFEGDPTGYYSVDGRPVVWLPHAVEYGPESRRIKATTERCFFSSEEEARKAIEELTS